MKKVTVQTKLMACVGSLAALGIVLSATFIYTVGQLRSNVDLATGDIAKKLELTGALSTATSDMLVAQYRMILADARGARDVAEQQKQTYQKRASQLREAFTAVAPLLVTEEGRRAVETIQASYHKWVGEFPAIAVLSAEGKTTDAAEVTASRIVPEFDRIAAASDELTRVQQTLNSGLRASAASGARTGETLAWGGLLVIGVCSILVFFVVKQLAQVLKQLSSQMSETAQQVASAAGQVASASQNLAQGASEQAASLEETSASSEELTSMTRKNSENSLSAAQLMNRMEVRVGEANHTLAQMVVSMDQINSSAGKIAKIIKVIDEIAFQTNILALNAAVEAARAGDAGMGFAVVADEVRNLAQRSAQAAKDTAQMIEEAITRSTEGKSKLQDVGSAITGITGEAQQVKTLVDEVSIASQEQTRGFEGIAKAIIQMEQVTQTSAATAEESASASEELSAMSEAMRKAVGELSELVGMSATQAAPLARTVTHKK